MALIQLPPYILQPPSQAELTPAISSLRSHVKGKAGSEDGSCPLFSFTNESGQSTPISYDDIYQCMEESEDAQEMIRETLNNGCLWQAFCQVPAVMNYLKSRMEDGFNRAKTEVSNMLTNNSHDNLTSNSEKPKLWWEHILSTLSEMGEAIWKFMMQMFEGIHSGIKGNIEIIMKDYGHPTIEVLKDSGHQLKSLVVSFFTSIVAMFGVLLDRLAKQATMI